jgi:very-short-patch-repair endonuclease
MRRRLNNRLEYQSRRRKLRHALTPAEARLWLSLQRRQLDCKFRRQHSVGPFILDFYCPHKRLAIELDGAAHDSDAATRYDERRSRYLEQIGVRVIRFLNDDVMQNLEGVLKVIRDELTTPR